jgi:hypothetical protein
LFPPKANQGLAGRQQTYARRKHFTEINPKSMSESNLFFKISKWVFTTHRRSEVRCKGLYTAPEGTPEYNVSFYRHDLWSKLEQSWGRSIELSTYCQPVAKE